MSLRLRISGIILFKLFPQHCLYPQDVVPAVVLENERNHAAIHPCITFFPAKNDPGSQFFIVKGNHTLFYLKEDGKSTNPVASVLLFHFLD